MDINKAVAICISIAYFIICSEVWDGRFVLWMALKGGAESVLCVGVGLCAGVVLFAARTTTYTLSPEVRGLCLRIGGPIVVSVCSVFLFDGIIWWNYGVWFPITIHTVVLLSVPALIPSIIVLNFAANHLDKIRWRQKGTQTRL